MDSLDKLRLFKVDTREDVERITITKCCAAKKVVEVLEDIMESSINYEELVEGILKLRKKLESDVLDNGYKKRLKNWRRKKKEREDMLC